MSGISLTSSMRNNLLSLQQTAKLQDMTQNRLATGLKVNSAIDNPSSYYTAQSLNNRAEDLNILLDAMSQGIQTLKAVNESIEAGTKFLEQAKSVANSALETAQPVVAKVSTEAELLAAVNSGKQGLIVLTSDIAMSTNQNIVLNDGQSLVGARYLDKSAAQTKLSFNMTEEKNGIDVGNNSLVSDLFVEIRSTQPVKAVIAEHRRNVTLNNLTIDINHTYSNQRNSAAILVDNSEVNIKGKTDLNVNGVYTRGIINTRGSVINVKAELTINTHGKTSYAIDNIGSTMNIDSSFVKLSTEDLNSSVITGFNATLNLTGKTTLNAETKGSANVFNLEYAGAIGTINVRDEAIVNVTSSENSTSSVNSGILNLTDNAKFNILTKGDNRYGFYKTNIKTNGNSTLNILSSGNNGRAVGIGKLEIAGSSQVNIKSVGPAIADSNVVLSEKGKLNIDSESWNFYSDNHIKITSEDAVMNLKAVANNFGVYNGLGTYITAIAGAQINTNSGHYIAQNDISTPSMTGNTNVPEGFNQLNSNPAVIPSQVSDIFNDFENYMANSFHQLEILSENNKDISSLSQFNQILNQYDSLINDSWYKGVNLLKQQDLKVVFNESRTSDLDIKGVDATTKGLGLETADWNSSAGVQASLDQIDSAINQLRLYASEFGNYYQIVTTRENFTNSLINVLTEGADALTLADMNQESANMLALQTRQQLAVNSLSLASQASQSVLKLF